MKDFLKLLESPNYPLLAPNVKGLQFAGMLQRNGKLSRFIYNMIHLGATLFVLSQYIELWIIRHDLSSALRNLSISMLSTVCVVKAWTFVSWQKYWKDIIDSISIKEKNRLSVTDEFSKNLVEGYIGYSRKVTYLYWVLVTSTVFTVILAPLAAYMSSPKYQEMIRNGSAPYPEIMSSWVPFDKTTPYGLAAYALEHICICFYGGGIVATFDANAVAIMIYFAGQLKLLQHDCKNLFGSNREDVSPKVALSNIRKCHFHHLFLIKYAKKFNALLSPVMFLYIVICSLMICSSAVQLTSDGTTTMQQIWIAEYLIALIAQLFLYCYHGNEVLFMSENVDRGVYESAWWTRNARVRRSALLLAGQLRKTIVFEGGPFTTLTVSTFVAIMKGSYSYYAILSKNGEERN